MSVPLFDPAGPLRPLRDELRVAVGRVLDREQYILGEEVEGFEREFAAYIGAREAVGVANGTEAITIGLRASASAGRRRRRPLVQLPRAPRQSR
jgi:dTDP-4-amino-4,6-dideoxygalactose transaminase